MTTRLTKKTQAIAAEMFTEFLNENIVAIRVSATLKYCSKDRLAKAIEAPESDRSFKNKLQEHAVDGRFSGLPSYAVLQAQTAANNLAVGYNFGFIEALRLTSDSGKSLLCATAVEGANKILAK
jgi:hypothetical protein